MRKFVVLLIAAVVAVFTMGAAKGCDASPPRPAHEAAYAGDGATQFKATGKLKFGVVYRATAVDSTDRQNCEWSVYTISKEGGSVKTVGKGNYLKAKIRVPEDPQRTTVWLKSSECGDWKPQK